MDASVYICKISTFYVDTLTRLQKVMTVYSNT